MGILLAAAAAMSSDGSEHSTHEAVQFKLCCQARHGDLQLSLLLLSIVCACHGRSLGSLARARKQGAACNWASLDQVSSSVSYLCCGEGTLGMTVGPERHGPYA